MKHTWGNLDSISKLSGWEKKSLRIFCWWKWKATRSLSKYASVRSKEAVRVSLEGFGGMAVLYDGVKRLSSRHWSTKRQTFAPTFACSLDYKQYPCTYHIHYIPLKWFTQTEYFECQIYSKIWIGRIYNVISFQWK